MPTFKSGAFAQQCFSSHPHSLTFKALTLITPVTTPSLPPDAPGRVLGPQPPPAKTAPFPLASAGPGSAISPACPEPAETGSFSHGTEPFPPTPPAGSV